jgi:hypothetical protein
MAAKRGMATSESSDPPRYRLAFAIVMVTARALLGVSRSAAPRRWRVFAARGRSVFARLAFAVALAAGAAACPGEPTRPQPLLQRPIDEGHAVAIIGKAFRDLRLEPERGRSIHIGDKAKELRLDVASRGKRWGVAFISSDDASKLGEAIPRRAANDSSLIYMHGASEDEGDTYAVFLFAGDYIQDDLQGESHTATSIAAEQRLDGDTRDAIRLAQRQGWE